MKKKHKIPPDDYKWIKNEAAKLPEMHRLGIGGKALVRTTTKVNKCEWDEKKQSVHTNYTRNTGPVLVNHENEMVTAYWAEGKRGAELYIEMIHKIDYEAGAMKLMAPFMKAMSLDPDVDLFETEWVQKIAPFSNEYFKANPHHYTDKHVEVVFNWIVGNETPEKAEEYTDRKGFNELKEILTTYNEHLYEIH